jgi:hypothetical protein
MTLITTLNLIHETEDNAHYAEAPGKERYPILGTLSVQKWALPRPTPTAIRLSLESYEVEAPSPPVRSVEEVGRIHEVDNVLVQGASVTIVKNRLADIHQPAEWLEQYLGRKGTVLWTTAGGAMVRLDKKEATWFPYAELAVDD